MIKATPVASFIILSLVWLGTAAVPIFMAFLMVLPIIWANVMQGIHGVDREYLEMARIFAMSRGKRLMKIYIPCVLPYFIAGCRSALGIAWKAGIAAEVLATPAGSIGKNLYEAKIYLNTADVFAWTAVVVIMSLVIEKLFLRILHLATRRWQGGQT